MANIEFSAKAVIEFRKRGNSRLAAKAADFLAQYAPPPAELIREAGILNSGKLANVDHVTIMGMMDHAEMVLHVAKLRALAA